MSDTSMSDDDRMRAVRSRFVEMLGESFPQMFAEALEKMSPEQVTSLLSKLDTVRAGNHSQGQQSVPVTHPQQVPQRPVKLSAFDKFVLGKT